MKLLRKLYYHWATSTFVLILSTLITVTSQGDGFSFYCAFAAVIFSSFDVGAHLYKGTEYV